MDTSRPPVPKQPYGCLSTESPICCAESHHCPSALTNADARAATTGFASFCSMSPRVRRTTVVGQYVRGCRYRRKKGFRSRSNLEGALEKVQAIVSFPTLRGKERSSRPSFPRMKTVEEKANRRLAEVVCNGGERGQGDANPKASDCLLENLEGWFGQSNNFPQH